MPTKKVKVKASKGRKAHTRTIRSYHTVHADHKYYTELQKDLKSEKKGNPEFMKKLSAHIKSLKAELLISKADTDKRLGRTKKKK